MSWNAPMPVREESPVCRAGRRGKMGVKSGHRFFCPEPLEARLRPGEFTCKFTTGGPKVNFLYSSREQRRRTKGAVRCSCLQESSRLLE